MVASYKQRACRILSVMTTACKTFTKSFFIKKRANLLVIISSHFRIIVHVRTCNCKKTVMKTRRKRSTEAMAKIIKYGHSCYQLQSAVIAYQVV